MAIAVHATPVARPPTVVDRTTDYARAVDDGHVVVGDLVRRACKRHLSDLKSGAKRGLRFDVAEGERSIDFFPAALRHWKGALGGQPVHLAPWQQFIVGSVFGWQRRSEQHDRWIRRFRLAYVEVAKKNGKTLKAAGVGLRLAFFDDEPGAEVYSVATKRDQAKFVWNDALQAVKKSPALARRIVPIESRSNLHDPVSGSKFEPLGKDSRTADQGINVHGAIIDELHVHRDREQYDNVETATAARIQPLRFVITTAGVKRAGSVWADERADVVRILEGVVEDDSVFGYIATLDKGDDPFDEAVWPKANPNLNISVDVEQLRIAAAKAKRSPSAMSAYLRFRMNLPTAQEGYGFDLDAWDANPVSADEPGLIAGFVLPHLCAAGRVAFGGLDLASTRDLTAFIVLLGDGEYVDVVPFFWCPRLGIDERSESDHVPYRTWSDMGLLKATEGNVTDYDVIRADIAAIAQRWAFTEIGYDPWNATQLATQLQQDGAAIVPIAQGYSTLSEPTRELERLVYDGKLRGADHPILRWMAGNTVFEEGPNESVRPSKAKSEERIDGIVSLIMGISRRMVRGDAEISWGMV